MPDERTMSPLLAIASQAAVFGSLLLLMGIELRRADALRSLVYAHTQKAMLAISGGAMAASLYYSESVGFIPCEFCWYQRIAMYPLAVLLGIAVASRSRIQPRFLLGLAGIGLALSIYHYQLQLFPDQHGACSGPVSCTGKYVEEFGMITIPFMAGSGFLSILLLQFGEWRVDRLYRKWDPEWAGREGTAED